MKLRYQAPGDTAAASRLVHALAQSDTSVSIDGAGAAELFANDPRVIPRPPGTREVLLDYMPFMNAAAAGCRHLYFDGPVLAFTHACDIPLVPTLPVPCLIPHPVPKWAPKDPYWVVAAGSKNDMPIKQWPVAYFQELREITAGTTWVQVGATSGGPGHQQHILKGVVNKVGKTTITELCGLIAGAAGVICHVSMPYVIAAAYRTPCVVIGGAREAKYLHTVPLVVWPTLAYLGAPEQCECKYAVTSGCWRISADKPERVPMSARYCELPIMIDKSQPTAGCLADITPAIVAAAVRRLGG